VFVQSGIRIDPAERWAWRIFGVVLVYVGVMAASALSETAVAQPRQTERPRLQLVRVISCDASYGMEKCRKSVEEQANDWLQKAQPDALVLEMSMSSFGSPSTGGAFLLIRYEVPDWRVAVPKPLAETER
jgi:hypothetical protein